MGGTLKSAEALHVGFATGGVPGSCSDTSGALQGRFWGRGRLNSRSRKRRRSRPCSASYMPESPRSTADAIWRKCVVFAKTRFAGPGPNSSSRRRSRGAKGRFGPLVDRSCRMQRAAEDGTDPGAPWSYSGLRNSQIARRYPIWCQNNFALSLDLGGGHPLPMTRRTRPFAPLPARRFGHCAFGAA